MNGKAKKAIDITSNFNEDMTDKEVISSVEQNPSFKGLLPFKPSGVQLFRKANKVVLNYSK